MEATLKSAFARIVRPGDLTVHYPSGAVQRLGDGTLPTVVVRIATPAAVRALVRDPALALGECYMAGTLTIEEGSLYDFVSLLARGGVARGWTFAGLPAAAWRALRDSLRQRAGIGLARRNIAHHYDLTEELFRLFLDRDMNYSCAYFEDPDMTLEAAQRAKQRHVAAKLLSRPGARALDIGCGWGGMGLYLDRVAGLDVTGVTLSEEQRRVATERASAAGAQARFDLRDYREVEGSFDHIVSIGMLEHVGRPQLRTYFQTVARLLDKQGTALIHSMAQPRPQLHAQPFGDKYIFPGGYIPSLGEILPAVEAAGLLIKDIEILPLHYAETCRIWRERFLARRAEATALYDERFARMWEVYLVGAEVGFRHNRIFVAHLQLARHQDRIPIRRTWYAEERARLLEAEAAWPIP
ncbi:MAG: cyclopropane-fatty-acyl-phospholipid synthase family protein [Pseudomonadota bacterium]